MIEGDKAHAIVLMNRAGKRIRTVALATGFLKTPQWSPDGRRLAFVSVHRGVAWITVTQGARLVQLARGFDPAWAAHGTRIAYARASGIYTIRADGSGRKQVGKCDMRLLLFYCREPRWSPDGKRLAWITGRDDYAGLWVTAPGLRRARFATGIADDTYVWSKDGRRIFLLGLERQLPSPV